MWAVEIADEFEPEFSLLDEDVQTQILALSRLLQQLELKYRLLCRLSCEGRECPIASQRTSTTPGRCSRPPRSGGEANCSLAMMDSLLGMVRRVFAAD
jgi:hypothetical protein